MPTYTVPLVGGGSMTVNASSPAAAVQNVNQSGGGNRAVGTATDTGAQPGGQIPGSSGGGGGGGGTSGSGPSEFYTTGQHNASADATAAAHEAAQKAYWEALTSGAGDRLAFERSKEAAAEAYRQATLDFEKQKFSGTQGVEALKLSASLRGPRNAFQQQQVNYGLNAQGFSPLAGAIAGHYTLPKFQAPRGTAQAASLGTLAADMSGGTGFGNASGGDAPTADQMHQSTQAFLNALPNPNQIGGRQWNALPTDTRAFLTSAYGAKGYGAGDIDDAVKAGLPQFNAPTIGLAAV